MQTCTGQTPGEPASTAKGSPFLCECGTNMAMNAMPKARSGRKPRPKPPLDEARLQEMALAYVARFATSAARLEAYLARKLRERGWEGKGAPDLVALSARFAELGYIDDESFARAKAGGLLRRGYGSRRIAQALSAAGIAEDLRDAARPDARAARLAALALARRRRLGPFAAADEAVADPDERRKRREKQIAALIRAGHEFALARAVIDADSVASAEAWAEREED